MTIRTQRHLSGDSSLPDLSPASSDLLGRVTRLDYDGANRLIKETDPLENVLEYENDPAGNVTKVTAIEQHPDRNGTTESFISGAAYDGLDRPVITAMQGADGAFNPDDSASSTIFTFMGYDSRSNPTHFKDPRGNPSQTLYDGVSRPVQTVEQLHEGGVGSGDKQGEIKTTYEYDPNRNLTSITDANNHTTSYDFDALDRLFSMTLANGRQWRQDYNKASDVVKRYEPNGNVLGYQYDALGRLLNVTAIAAGPDVAGQTSGVLQSFEYDGMSRVTRAIDHTAEGDTAITARTTDYIYNNDDQVVEERDADGTLRRQHVWGQYVDELVQQREYHQDDA
ncbi:MAG: RHS repeat protein, partial [Phycisphaeraceae bacterium]|nr:RHS repeat protein [Phycisphaeraceae bacterium]